MAFRLMSALALGLLPAAAAAVAADGTIYVMRHGEKTWTLGCLNELGQGRAQNLVDVFSGHASTAYDVFPEPKAIFANRYGDLIDCERCVQTLTPLAEAHNLTVNNAFGYNPWVSGNKKGAAAIKEALRTTGGPVVVAWEHINIQHVTRHLGVPRESIPTWGHGDYDTIYELTFNSTLDLQSFRVSAQNFSLPEHRRLSPGAVVV